MLFGNKLFFISVIEFCISFRPRSSADAFISDVDDLDDTCCIDEDVVVELLEEEL